MNNLKSMKNLLSLLILISIFGQAQVTPNYSSLILKNSKAVQNEKFISSVNEVNYFNNIFLINNDQKAFISEKNINNQPDSIYIYKFTSEKDSSSQMRFYYKYDASRNEILHVSYYVHLISNKWVGLTKRESAYDLQGYKSLNAQYGWNLTTDSWVGEMKYTSNNDYSNNQHIYINYSWNSNTGQWTIMDSIKTKTDFFNDKDTSVTVSYNWDYETNRWLERRRNEVIYSKGKVLLNVVYNWDSLSKQWVGEYREEFAYNDNWDELSETRFAWSMVQNQWINQFKAEFNYDSENREIAFNSFEWNKLSNTWISLYKSETSYNSFGNVTLDISFKWDTISSQWFGYMKNEHLYDTNGNLTLDESFSWNNNKLVSNERIEYKYNFEGNLEFETHIKNWNESTNYWSFKDEYAYDNTGNIKISTGYTWNTITQNWDGLLKYSYYYDEKGNENLVLEYQLDTISNDWVLKYKTYSYFPYNTKLQITNAQKNENIRVYPNPANEILYIKLNEKPLSQGMLYNSSGQLIRNFEIQTGVNSIYIGDLKSGLYYIQIKMKNGDIAKKVIKFAN